MSQPSSSTSSSEADSQVRYALATLAWIIGWLIVLDVLVDIAFRYPSDPRATNPSQLQLYFEYGRSAEAKRLELEIERVIEDNAWLKTVMPPPDKLDALGNIKNGAYGLAPNPVRRSRMRAGTSPSSCRITPAGRVPMSSPFTACRTLCVLRTRSTEPRGVM